MTSQHANSLFIYSRVIIYFFNKAFQILSVKFLSQVILKKKFLSKFWQKQTWRTDGLRHFSSVQTVGVLPLVPSSKVAESTWKHLQLGSEGPSCSHSSFWNPNSHHACLQVNSSHLDRKDSFYLVCFSTILSDRWAEKRRKFAPSRQNSTTITSIIFAIAQRSGGNPFVRVFMQMFFHP